MSRTRVFSIAIGLSVILFIFMVVLSAGEGFSSVARPDKGLLYIVFVDEQVPRQEADELVAADGMLYLYYEDYGLVNVYSTEGNYQWSYQVAPGRNGAGGIGYADGIFYLRSKVYGVFGFRGTEIAPVEERDEDAIVDGPNPVTDGGYTYYYNAVANQINRAGKGEVLETVVQLPVENPHVGALRYVLGVIWVAFALYGLWEKKLRNHSAG